MDNARLPLEHELRRLDLIYRQSLQGTIAILAIAAAFVTTGWSLVPHVFLVTWTGVVVSSAVYRFWLTARWSKLRHAVTSHEELLPWRRRIEALLLVSGFAWGALGLAFPWLPFPAQMMVAGLIFGMTAGALASYAPSLVAMYCVLIPATSCFAVGLLFTPTPIMRAMSALTILYAVLMARIGRNLNRHVITALKLNSDLAESQERLRLSLESSGAMTWDWDVATDEFTCAGNVALFFPGEPSGTHRGRFSDYAWRVHEEDRASFLELTRETSRPGPLDAEHRFVNAEGHLLYVAFRGRVHEDGHVSGICWDITSKKNEERLRVERDVIEASNRAKMMFLANASHEIRTPLAAINGFTEAVLENPDLPPSARDDLQIILRNGRYLVSVVSDLLDLSKSETHRMFVQHVSIDPLREIDDSLLVVRTNAQRKDLKLELKFLTATPERIVSDPTRFRQILINLLTNAVKYTERGVIEVNVACEQTGEGEGTFRVTVRDSGLGIPPEYRERIFQPFVRAEMPETLRTVGSGLGLALARSLARQMGGDVRLVDSELGRGSVFEMSIATGSLKDVRFRSTHAPESAQIPTGTSAEGIARLAGRRILLVEDDPDLRFLMQRYLEREGAAVAVATNGADAVDRASKSPFDVILMDIKMPVMDGYQATARLRELGYRNPIVALTAHASTDDKQMCYQAGCDSYLSKPVDTRHLLRIINKHLQDVS